ncbi:MAG: LysR family transcriptional regulator [Acidimicrobiia bacterium]
MTPESGLGDLRALALLVSVVELGSLFQAAALHGVSQPAASARLDRLESRLGLRLVVRSTRGCVPTPDGAAVVEWSREILALADRTGRAVGTLREVGGAVPIAASLTTVAAGNGAIVIRSRSSVFSAGFDLSDVERETDATLIQRFVALQTMLDELNKAPMVSYAIVDGPAVGAGADLAIACDFRIVMQNARFRFPGSHFGVLLGVPRLCSIVGRTRARS